MCGVMVVVAVLEICKQTLVRTRNHRAQRRCTGRTTPVIDRQM